MDACTSTLPLSCSGAGSILVELLEAVSKADDSMSVQGACSWYSRAKTSTAARGQ